MQFFKDKKYVLDFPGIPVVKTMLPMQWAQVWSLVRQLRSHVMCSIAKKKKVPVKISDNRGNRDSDLYYYKGIDDLLIKYKYASYIILKANVIKIHKITWHFPIYKSFCKHWSLMNVVKMFRWSIIPSNRETC